MQARALAAITFACLVSACAGEAPTDTADVGDQEPVVPADEAVVDTTEAIPPGTLARVCNASALNQRTGPGTGFAVLRLLPSGATTKILGSSGGWYRHDWNGSVGWSSAAYLCPAGDSKPDDPGAGFDSTEISRTSFLSIARASVGFSYWWGGGRLAEGANPGTCSGACPSCTHGGSYGADCSGFIAKAWLLPAALPMDSNKHPYSTANFVVSSSLWTVISRASIQPGDSLVHRANGAGHIVMYEKDDPWGSFWAFEARGCSYGIVHNIRTVTSTYKTIRRAGL